MVNIPVLNSIKCAEEKDRLHNYDFLRVVAIFGVVLVHVSGIWVANGGMIKNHPVLVIAYMFNSIPRFGVPCFLMLSGALLLSKSQKLEDGSLDRFYRKCFYKFGIPTLIFTIIYIVFNYITFRFGILKIKDTSVILINAMKGIPMYHMWFMYMFLGICLFVPFVHMIKERLADTTFNKMGVAFCIMSVMSAFVSESYAAWDIGRSFEFLSLFIMGYVIHKHCNIANNKKGIFYIVAGLIIFLYAGLTAAYKLNNYFKISTLLFPMVPLGHLDPLRVIASLLVFSGFSLLEVKENRFIRNLSDRCFNIYLVHALFVELLVKVPIWKIGFRKALNDVCYAACIPIMALLVFAISYWGGIIFSDIYKPKKC